MGSRRTSVFGFDQWLVVSNPHAAAARVNSGDCMSIVAGNTRITPSRSLITPPPPRVRLDRGGAEVLGSGNWLMPCRRMHCATFTQWVSACEEGGGPEPEPGRPPNPGTSFRHFVCAAWNAGEPGLIPGGRVMPPLGFGSG